MISWVFVCFVSLNTVSKILFAIFFVTIRKERIIKYYKLNG